VRLAFTKMQGAGNDFVVLDCTEKKFSLSRQQIRRLADRHFGVGCDQVLVVEKPQQRANDFRYRIFNADGGEVEQCGNGARCFVKFVHARGLTAKRELRVETPGGLIAPRLEADGEVNVDMWYGVFAPKGMPAAQVATLNREINDILRSEEVKKAFEGQGMDPASDTPEGFAKLVNRDADRWAALIKAQGIKAE